MSGKIEFDPQNALVMVRVGRKHGHDQYEGIGFDSLTASRKAVEHWNELRGKQTFLVYNGKVYETTPLGFANAASDKYPEADADRF
jgi:hypothetical protein